MLSDEEIDMAHVKFAWVNLNCIEHRNAFARAIESAACAERDARIAELNRSLEVMAKNTEEQARASVLREIELTEKLAELEQQLAEARKDADRWA